MNLSLSFSVMYLGNILDHLQQRDAYSLKKKTRHLSHTKKNIGSKYTIEYNLGINSSMFLSLIISFINNKSAL